PIHEMPAMPESIINQSTNTIMTSAQLMEHVPLEKFVFEGVAVIRVSDVTEETVISTIKNRLIDDSAFSNASTYTELENHIQGLIGIKVTSIGITPFFKINGHYVYSDLHNSNSLLFRHFHSNTDKDEISDYCKLLFRENSQPLLFETLSPEVLDN